MILGVRHNCLNLRWWELELLGNLNYGQAVVEVVNNSIDRHTSSAENRGTT